MSAPITKKRARGPYEFATAGNYPAGANPWNGQPSVVIPTDSVMAAGLTPDTPVDAPTVNYLEQIRADAFTIQCHDAISRWSHATAVDTAVGSLAHLLACYPLSVAGPQVKQPATIAVIGNKVSNTHALVGRSADGQNFSGGAAYDLGFNDFSAIAKDDFGGMFGGLAGGTTCKSVAFDNGPTTATFTPGNTHVVDCAHFGAGHYLISDGAAMCRASSLGGTWTQTSIGSFGDVVFTICDNGDQTAGIVATVICMVHKVASNSHERIFYSTDDGLSWTLGHDFGVAFVNMCWSPFWGLFVAIDSTNGKVWTSPDGAAWTQGKNFPANTVELTVSPGTAKMAACGSCIAVLVNRVPSTGINLRGIAYTFDLGNSWQEHYFGDLLFGSQPILEIITANGRFYATDNTNVYSSGMLESPAYLYLG